MKLRKDYIMRLSRTKRKNIPEKEIMKFETPEHFTIFNQAVNSIERRTRKKYSVRLYKLLIDKFSVDNAFNNSCDIYLKNPDKFTKPSLCKINKNGFYTVDNLKVNDLKDVSQYLFETTKESEMRSIDMRMKDSVGYSFLMTFDDPDKIRFLLKSIKSTGKQHRNFNFSSVEKQEYITKFYYDKVFSRLYTLYTKSNNKYIRPSLDHIQPLCKGGTNTLDNLQYISYLENIAKHDMTQKDWNIIKKNLHKFITF